MSCQKKMIGCFCFVGPVEEEIKLLQFRSRVRTKLFMRVGGMMMIDDGDDDRSDLVSFSNFCLFCSAAFSLLVLCGCEPTYKTRSGRSCRVTVCERKENRSCVCWGLDGPKRIPNNGSPNLYIAIGRLKLGVAVKK